MWWALILPGDSFLPSLFPFPQEYQEREVEGSDRLGRPKITDLHIFPNL
jgi:hypothetical protein